mmetsp:Transcript_125798/g.361711  ORF Transcript_125798/g.361711 Transcript_125798/m.361711 type:complete len:604 (+) Transcript_125798:3-1814(+)
MADADRLVRDHRFFGYAMFRYLYMCFGRCGYQKDRLFHGRALQAQRAPEPTNIIWENQDVPHVERKVRHALVMFAFLIIVLLSFTLVYLANAAAKSQTKSTTQLLGNDACDPEIGKINPDNTEYLCYVDTALNWTMSFVETATADEKACYCGAIGYANIARSTALINGVCRDWLIAVATGIGIGVCATGIVVVINVVAKMVLIQLSYAEKPLSYSALNAAQMVKIFALQTLNTGFVIFCVNFSPPDWFPLGSLIFLGEFSDSVRGWYVVVGAAIMSNMLANAVTPAASNVCVMIANKFQRWCCSKRQKHQLQLRQLYTNPEFDMAARFAQLLNTVFVTLAYSSGMPLLNAFACMYMFFTFWADKVVLLWGSRRPPAYDTQIPKQAADIMLYAIPLHCFFAVWMMGQPCTFPSNPLGGTLQSLANQGISSAGSTSNFAASDGVLDRGMKESTWMVFALLVLLVAVYILWTVLWILGGTLGEFFKAMFTLCCSRAKRIAPESHVEVQTWAMVKADIARDFPPASYMMEEHPMYKEAAQFMRTRTSFNERKNEKKAAMAPSDSAKTGDGGPDNATAQASNKDANQDAETARDVAADKAPSEARQED